MAVGGQTQEEEISIGWRPTPPPRLQFVGGSVVVCSGGVRFLKGWICKWYESLRFFPYGSDWQICRFHWKLCVVKSPLATTRLPTHVQICMLVSNRGGLDSTHASQRLSFLSIGFTMNEWRRLGFHSWHWWARGRIHGIARGLVELVASYLELLFCRFYAQSRPPHKKRTSEHTETISKYKTQTTTMRVPQLRAKHKFKIHSYTWAPWPRWAIATSWLDSYELTRLAYLLFHR